jgi:hypothetical protein
MRQGAWAQIQTGPQDEAHEYDPYNASIMHTEAHGGAHPLPRPPHPCPPALFSQLLVAEAGAGAFFHPARVQRAEEASWCWAARPALTLPPAPPPAAPMSPRSAAAAAKGRAHSGGESDLSFRHFAAPQPQRNRSRNGAWRPAQRPGQPRPPAALLLAPPAPGAARQRPAAPAARPAQPRLLARPAAPAVPMLLRACACLCRAPDRRHARGRDGGGPRVHRRRQVGRQLVHELPTRRARQLRVGRCWAALPAWRPRGTPAHQSGPPGLACTRARWGGSAAAAQGRDCVGAALPGPAPAADPALPPPPPPPKVCRGVAPRPRRPLPLHRRRQRPGPNPDHRADHAPK